MQEFRSSREIAAMIADKLLLVKVDQDGWRVLYRHRDTGRLWEKSYPYSELHGGGSPLLRELATDEPEDC